MRRKEIAFSTPQTKAASQRLGTLVREARLARAWTQAELAERARVGLATLKRIETGALEASLGAWLSVLEKLGLLPLLQALEDPVSTALLRDTQSKRARRSSKDLDF